jgi:P27 family predicted phage terminase small subunit
MPGRPRSAKAKKLEAGAAHRPAALPVRGEPGAIEQPKNLDELAQKYWSFFVEQLTKRGDLEKIDGPALADCCTCFSRLRQAEDSIAESGVLIKGYRGIVKNPAVQIARQYRAQAQRYIDLFGFAPGPRNRMTLPDPDIDHDPSGLLD